MPIDPQVLVFIDRTLTALFGLAPIKTQVGTVGYNGLYSY